MRHRGCTLALAVSAAGALFSCGADTVSEESDALEAVCTPTCLFDECGDDGCGGSCGECECGNTCDDLGHCVVGTTDMESFRDNCDGTLSEHNGPLQWQKGWNGEFVTWAAASKYCHDLVLAGFDDWDLPEISDLRQLIKGCPQTAWGGDCPVEGFCVSSCATPACKGCGEAGGPGEAGCFMDPVFGGPCSWYWSRTDAEAPLLWAIGFQDAGLVTADSTGNVNAARCVRNNPDQ